MSILINGFLIDASLNENHSFTNEVTQHPVEKGADITDHARARPIEISITGLVSDTPIGFVADERAADSLPSDSAYKFLLELRDAREPVSISTSLGTFQNMLLQSLTVPRAANNGDALRFDASFIQVTLVTNNRTTVRVSAPRAKKKEKRGNKTLQNPPAKPAPPEKSKSILKGLIDSGVGL